MLVGQYLVTQQSAYLMGATPALKPLLVKDVAAHLGFSSSTISRTINNHYLMWHNQPLELKQLISAPIRSDGESQSTVLWAIQEIVNHEDREHPLSDEKNAVHARSTINSNLASNSYEVSPKTKNTSCS